MPNHICSSAPTTWEGRLSCVFDLRNKNPVEVMVATWAVNRADLHAFGFQVVARRVPLPEMSGHNYRALSRRLSIAQGLQAQTGSMVQFRVFFILVVVKNFDKRPAKIFPTAW